MSTTGLWLVFDPAKHRIKSETPHFHQRALLVASRCVPEATVWGLGAQLIFCTVGFRPTIVCLCISVVVRRVGIEPTT